MKKILSIIIFCLFLIGPAFAVEIDTQFTAIWDYSKPGDADYPNDLKGFRLYYGTTTDVNQFTKDIPLASVPPNQDDQQRKFIFKQKANEGETYYFILMAYDEAGNESEPSNMASAVIPEIDVPPDAPLNLKVVVKVVISP